MNTLVLVRRSLLITALLTLGACGGDQPPHVPGAAHGDHAEHAGHDEVEGDAHAHEDDVDHGDSHGHAEPATEQGSHGGRLLRDGALSVELLIFERGVAPEFRAWLYRDGVPLAPAAGQLQVTLSRLGGAVDVHTFVVQADYLRSGLEVYEPHSFDVQVQADFGAGARAQWQYASHEGRTRIDAAVADQAGIRVAAAGPGLIRDQREVQGLLTVIEGRHARVSARFAGPIRSVEVGVGDRVSAGQRLATVESNVSLSNYPLTAPLAGTVLMRSASVGEIAAEAPLFEIADLSVLWVDLHLFGADAQRIRPGLSVRVSRLADGVEIETTLERVLPLTATASQSTVARARIENPDGQWRPGSAVRAQVTVEETEVALRVPLSALQRFRDFDVVFIRVGDEYEIRPLELGRRDGQQVEVLAGLNPGDAVVIEQSYLVKADIEKSGASHDH
jgi:cobalt-zinc-cadmium efflux system membrane fusion protein